MHDADASSHTSHRMSGMRACPHNSCSVVGGDRRRRCVTLGSNEDIIQEHHNVNGDEARLLKLFNYIVVGGHLVSARQNSRQIVPLIKVNHPLVLSSLIILLPQIELKSKQNYFK